MKRTLTTSEVVDELRLSASAVQKHARNGDVPFEETPGGHRRYNLAEVKRALYPPKSALEALELDSALGAGAQVQMSPSALLQRDARTTVTPAGDISHEGERDSGDAPTDLFGHSRRVTVSTGS